MLGASYPLVEYLLVAAVCYIVWLFGMAGGVTCLLLRAFRPDVKIPRLRRVLVFTNLITSGGMLLVLAVKGIFEPGVIFFCTVSLIIGVLLGISGPTTPTIDDLPED